VKACYGVRLVDVCLAVIQHTNGEGWTTATVVLGHLRQGIPPEKATRLFIHWGNHQDMERRKQMPADVQLDQGRKCVVFRCLSNAKRAGYVISRGAPGGRREYQLTPKGLKLVKEYGYAEN